MNLIDHTINAMFPGAQSRAAGDFFVPFSGFNVASTDAGKKVNSDSAFKISAFWCGVINIANSVAMLPKHIYIRNDRETAMADHPANMLIHSEPNEMMSANDFWHAIVASAIVKGDGFAWIIRDGNGNPTEIVLWQYEDVQIFSDGRTLTYKHREHGKRVFLAWEVFHITGFGFNGIRGKSVISYAADNMGMSLSADLYGADAYNNRGISHGVIESDKQIKDVGKRNIRSLIKSDLKEIGEHKIAVLDEGMKYKNIALTPNESQFIQAKNIGVEDIARWLNIPLHKLHTKGEGGYNFLVQMSIEYIQSAVMPWGQKIKQEIQRKLLTRTEKTAGMYCFVNYRKLLEADPKTRAEYYKNMVYIKAMAPNEVRQNEDMNPYDGGDEFLQMTNMMTQTQIETETNGN